MCRIDAPARRIAWLLIWMPNAFGIKTGDFSTWLSPLATEQVSQLELEKIHQAARYHRNNHWMHIGEPRNHLATATHFGVLRGLRNEPQANQPLARGAFLTSDLTPLPVSAKDVLSGLHGPGNVPEVHGVPLAPNRRFWKNGYTYERGKQPTPSSNPLDDPTKRYSVRVGHPLGFDGDYKDNLYRQTWRAVQLWHNTRPEAEQNKVHHYKMLHLLREMPDSALSHTRVFAYDKHEQLIPNKQDPTTYVHQVPFAPTRPAARDAGHIIGSTPARNPTRDSYNMRRFGTLAAPRTSASGSGSESSRKLSADAQPFVPKGKGGRVRPSSPSTPSSVRGVH
ncbi:hypothetical protein IE81DRAFT_176780 [Ceraceosorus guamensis]|uniref:Uncharacterized protein n=1 Tax=Ceraceosorus guamensis TaxID=1522189 RepID=A0A316W1A3_9BASI|nr:hypothetical protein IE81DRAFT_176780 [Ceraceosorus guamensis]PWN41445.1 hypothetical protein IE81DRAFT_176780 [Ceraceosorus guamensis]